jgi:hypothetical protein
MLIDPLPRTGTTVEMSTEAPCGGIAKGKGHLLCEPGSLNPVGWTVEASVPKALCQVSVIDPNDPTRNQLLTPTDDTADEAGWFPCAQATIYDESKDFVFPTFVCNECSIQWILKAADGTQFYQCADVAIQENLFDWSTDYDNDDEISVVGYFVMFIVFVSVISCLACVVYYCFNQSKLPGGCQSCIRAICPCLVREDRLLAGAS